VDESCSNRGSNGFNDDGMEVGAGRVEEDAREVRDAASGSEEMVGPLFTLEGEVAEDGTASTIDEVAATVWEKAADAVALAAKVPTLPFFSLPFSTSSIAS